LSVQIENLAQEKKANEKKNRATYPRKLYSWIRVFRSQELSFSGNGEAKFKRRAEGYLNDLPFSVDDLCYGTYYRMNSSTSFSTANKPRLLETKTARTANHSYRTFIKSTELSPNYGQVKGVEESNDVKFHFDKKVTSGSDLRQRV